MALHPEQTRVSPTLHSESLAFRATQEKLPPKVHLRSQGPRCDTSEFETAQRADSLKASAVSRRQTLVKGLVAGLAVPSLFGSQPASAEPSGAVLPVDGESSWAVQVDEINAYAYTYPVTIGKGTKLSWVESSKPRRYSSPEPFFRYDRQRIVSERIDLHNDLDISVSVGPLKSELLKTNDINIWEPVAVAQSVLADTPPSPMTMGQRAAEVLHIVDAHKEDVDGVPYFYYEYLVQKSPTMIMQGGLDDFRHSAAVTVERGGYLYSLNASTLDSRWNEIGPAFNETVASFRMTSPTVKFVPPDINLWQSW